MGENRISMDLTDGGFLGEFRDALRRSGRLSAELASLEDTRKRTISGFIATSAESAAKAEHAARSHRDVQALDDEIAALRLQAADAAAEAKALEVRYEIWRTRSGNWRMQQERR